MSGKTTVYLFSFVGGTIGSLIPNLRGAGFLSFSSLILGALGGLIGIFIAIKLIN